MCCRRDCFALVRCIRSGGHSGREVAEQTQSGRSPIKLRLDEWIGNRRLATVPNPLGG